MILSKNAAGLLVLVLSLLGFEVSETALVEFLSAVGTVVSFGLLIYNQWTRKDTKGFFFKQE